MLPINMIPQTCSPRERCVANFTPISSFLLKMNTFAMSFEFRLLSKTNRTMFAFEFKSSMDALVIEKPRTIEIFFATRIARKLSFTCKLFKFKWNFLNLDFFSPYHAFSYAAEVLVLTESLSHKYHT